jgi:hypothetical protein
MSALAAGGMCHLLDSPILGVVVQIHTWSSEDCATMRSITRRRALRLSAAVAAAAVGTTATRAAAGSQERGKANNESPVQSKATAASRGPRECFAVVGGDGTLKRQMHVERAQRLSVGMYEVIFKRDVRRGVYVATLGGADFQGLPPVGQLGVMGRANNPRGVLVTVGDASGNPLDAGFHLLVVCPEGYA